MPKNFEHYDYDFFQLCSTAKVPFKVNEELYKEAKAIQEELLDTINAIIFLLRSFAATEYKVGKLLLSMIQKKVFLKSN